jgi:hypothetical protein
MPVVDLCKRRVIVRETKPAVARVSASVDLALISEKDDEKVARSDVYNDHAAKLVLVETYDLLRCMDDPVDLRV